MLKWIDMRVSTTIGVSSTQSSAYILVLWVCLFPWSTHEGFLKTKLIGLLPIRGVDPLGWFFEQPLLNGFSTGDGSFLPTNSHEGKIMKRMVEFLRWRRLTPIHVYLFRFSMYYHLNFFFQTYFVFYFFSLIKNLCFLVKKKHATVIIIWR